LTHYFGAAKDRGSQHLDFSIPPSRWHFAIAIVGPWAMDQTFEAMEPSPGFFGP
jgi:hypothetical protein